MNAARVSAFTSGKYNYEEALKLYDREISENPKNYQAINNRGLCKIHLGDEQNNTSLIRSGMEDFTLAIDLAKEEGAPLEQLEHNLQMAISFYKL